MNSYEKEVIENIKRHARHGKESAEKYNLCPFVDFFVAILDEISGLNKEKSESERERIKAGVKKISDCKAEGHVYEARQIMDFNFLACTFCGHQEKNNEIKDET